MQKLLNSAILILLTVCMFGCDKDSDPKATNTDLLTKSPWITINAEIGAGGVFTSDWASYDACDKDDITTFKTDKTYTVVEGATKCDAGDPDLIESGNWQFSSDEKMLIMDIYSWKIDQLDETTLKITITSGTDSFRLTYSH